MAVRALVTVVAEATKHCQLAVEALRAVFGATVES
jgi:hypothetical protein